MTDFTFRVCLKHTGNSNVSLVDNAEGIGLYLDHHSRWSWSGTRRTRKHVVQNRIAGRQTSIVTHESFTLRTGYQRTR